MALSVEQTLDFLTRQVNWQMRNNLYYRNLIEGSGDLPKTARTEEFLRLMELSRVDLGNVIVEAVSERLNVDGFRTDYRSIDGDEELGQAWSMAGGPFQVNLAMQEALTVGDGYLWLGKDEEDADFDIFAESSDNVAVQYKPGSRNKLIAALKVWTEWEMNIAQGSFATLVTETDVYEYQADGQFPMGYRPQAWKLISSYPHPYGEVPVKHFRNRPTLVSRWGRSETWGLENDLGRANKLMADLMLASEFSGYRVRWATGIDIEVDPVTGQPVQPFVIGPDRLIVAQGSDAKFGDLAESNLSQQLEVVKAAVSQVAALSRTPLFYLNGDMVNLSGDSLREMREQLRRKVVQRQSEFACAASESATLLARLNGLPVPDQIEVIWREVDEVDRYGSAQGAAQLVDAGIVPTDQVQIDLGYSTVERERMQQSLAAEQRKKMAQELVMAAATKPAPGASGASGSPAASGPSGP